MDALKLVLVDPNEAVVAAWREHFDDADHVEIVHDRFEALPAFDCMVSAANSFGLMDGGVDAAITWFFGHQLMDRVQQHILDEYLGEQPVGTSFLIETGHADHPWLAHTPTMRIPLDIRGTDQVYVAMLAMLQAVARHNRQHADAPIRIVACPGLGTLTGRVPAWEAARQMRVAWNSYVDPIRTIHWPVAQLRHDNVRWREVPPSKRGPT